MDPGAEEATRVLKAITGHALCEVCVARSTLLPVAVARQVLQRMASVLMIEAVRRCEECGSNINIYGFDMPPQPRSDSRVPRRRE